MRGQGPSAKKKPVQRVVRLSRTSAHLGQKALQIL